jgi:hypothetical protein
VKDLGVTIQNNLKSKNHVDNITASANRALFTIKRTMTFLNANTGTLLYKSLIRPILEYGSGAWHPTTIADIDKIESIQRATRWMLRNDRMPYDIRLQILGIPTLTHRRRRGD